MDETARGVSSTGNGLLVAQWYVDAFYDRVEDLPAIDTRTFVNAVERLEGEVGRIVEAALAQAQEQLTEIGVRLVRVER